MKFLVNFTSLLDVLRNNRVIMFYMKNAKNRAFF